MEATFPQATIDPATIIEISFEIVSVNDGPDLNKENDIRSALISPFKSKNPPIYGRL